MVGTKGHNVEHSTRDFIFLIIILLLLLHKFTCQTGGLFLLDPAATPVSCCSDKLVM